VGVAKGNKKGSLREIRLSERLHHIETLLMAGRHLASISLSPPYIEKISFGTILPTILETELDLGSLGEEPNDTPQFLARALVVLW